MAKKRIPRYKNHVMTAIDAAKLSIEMFNRIDANHSQQSALIFNAQAWELLSKGFLIRKNENIDYKDGNTITAERAINKLLHTFNVISKEEGKTIQQVISLRNEATHGILPKIDDEIITHLLYFSLKAFNDFLKKEFKTYAIKFDRNFLSISFKDHTFYSHRVTKLFSNSKKFDSKENKILYLLDRGCKFADNEENGRMKDYETWKGDIKKKPKGARIARHLSVYDYINDQDDIRFVPVEVARGHKPEVTVTKSKNPTSPVLIKKTDPNKDFPFFTVDLAEKINKSSGYTAMVCKRLNIRGNEPYSMLVKTSKTGGGVPKYNQKALEYLIKYLEKHPNFNPYK